MSYHRDLNAGKLPNLFLNIIWMYNLKISRFGHGEFSNLRFNGQEY